MTQLSLRSLKFFLRSRKKGRKVGARTNSRRHLILASYAPTEISYSLLLSGRVYMSSARKAFDLIILLLQLKCIHPQASARRVVD